MKVRYLYLFIYFIALVVTATDYRIRSLDEPVYLNATDVMRSSGDYLIPQYYWGKQRVNKPIGLYWLIIGGQYVLGKELLGARIISIIALFITVLLSYKIVKLLFPNHRNPEWVMFILPSIPFLFHMGRVATPEMTLVAFITLSHYFLFKILIGKSLSRKLIFAFYGSMGLGFMIKGPPAVVFPLLTAIVYLSATKQWKFLFTLIINIKGWALLMLIILPWYLFLIYQLGIDFFIELFEREIIQRIVFNNRTYSQGLFLITFSPWIWLALQEILSGIRSKPAASWTFGKKLIVSWFGSTTLFLILVVREYHNYYSLDYIVPVSLLVFLSLQETGVKKVLVTISWTTLSLYALGFISFPSLIANHGLIWIGMILLFAGAVLISIQRDLQKLVMVGSFVIVLNLGYNYIWVLPSINIIPYNKFITHVEEDPGSIVTSNRSNNLGVSHFFWYLKADIRCTVIDDKTTFTKTVTDPPDPLKYAICSIKAFDQMRDKVETKWNVVDESYLFQGDFGSAQSKGIWQIIKNGSPGNLLHRYVLLKRKS